MEYDLPLFKPFHLRRQCDGRTQVKLIFSFQVRAVFFHQLFKHVFSILLDVKLHVIKILNRLRVKL